MESRRLLLLLAGLTLVAGCSSGPVAPAAEVAPVLAATSATVGEPVSVSIPRLGVNDDIVAVGIAADDSMEIPPVKQVGWYDLAPKPGEVGPAVLAGHINYGGVAGSFARIGQLRAGDQITVTDSAGAMRTFVVYDVTAGLSKAKYEQVTVPLVFDPTPGPELRLVTCSGPLVDHNYLDNTVVRARAAAA